MWWARIGTGDHHVIIGIAAPVHVLQGAWRRRWRSVALPWREIFDFVQSRWRLYPLDCLRDCDNPHIAFFGQLVEERFSAWNGKDKPLEAGKR